MASFRITAGHYHSLPAVILCEAIIQRGHEVEAIHVVSPWQYRRLRSIVRQRGVEWLVRRATGHKRQDGSCDLDCLAAEFGITLHSLRRWANRHGVEVSTCRNLNDASVIEALRSGDQDAVVYAGGGILRDEFLQAARRTLNAHAGPLPQIRGMNAAEWAVLLDEPPEVTVHLIDRGIDTGPILRRRRYSRDGLRTVKQLRERAVATGIETLLGVIADGTWAEAGRRSAGLSSRQCFVMAPVLLEIVERRLSS